MKKVKLLPFLLVAPMLASCGLSKPSQPRFAKVTDKDKITGAKFIEETKKESEGMDFYSGSDKPIPSSVTKIESKYSRKSELLRKNKNIRGEDYLQNQTESCKLDTKNNVLQYEQSEVYQKSAKRRDFVASETYDNKSTDVYQVAKIDNVNYVVKANKETKEFTKVDKLEGDVKVEKVLNNEAKEKIDTFSVGFHGYTLADLVGSYYSAVLSNNTEEIAKYTFYKKDKVYTVEYISEVKDEEVKEADKLVAKQTIKKVRKAQVDFTKEKVKSLVWSTYEQTVNVLQPKVDSDSYGSYVCAKDDVQKFNWVASEVVTYERSDSKLKALDISKFTKIGETW